MSDVSPAVEILLTDVNLHLLAKKCSAYSKSSSREVALPHKGHNQVEVSKRWLNPVWAEAQSARQKYRILPSWAEMPLSLVRC